MIIQIQISWQFPEGGSRSCARELSRSLGLIFSFNLEHFFTTVEKAEGKCKNLWEIWEGREVKYHRDRDLLTNFEVYLCLFIIIDAYLYDGSGYDR